MLFISLLVLSHSQLAFCKSTNDGIFSPTSTSSSVAREGCMGSMQPPHGLYYANEFLNDSIHAIPPWAQFEMETLLNESVSMILHDYVPGQSFATESVGIGESGRSYFFLRLYMNDDSKEQYLTLAKRYIDSALLHLPVPSDTMIGMVAGNPGVYAVASMVYSLLGDNQTSLDFVDKMLGVWKEYLSVDSSGLFLNGLAGVIHVADLLQNFHGRQVVPEDVVVLAGELLFEQAMIHFNHSWNLMQFYDGRGSKQAWWIGHASGSSGAILQLLRSPRLMQNATILEHVRRNVEFYLSMEDHYPDRVQWCHGSPGFVPVYIWAYRVFQDSRYLDAAFRAAHYTAEKGILTKGMLLGHGAAGNIYMALQLFSFTKNATSLSWALSMVLQALKTPTLTDPSQFVSYDCFPGSVFISTTLGQSLLFSDLLTHQDDYSLVAEPLMGITWW